jgi:hypothetical protein
MIYFLHQSWHVCFHILYIYVFPDPMSLFTSSHQSLNLHGLCDRGSISGRSISILTSLFAATYSPVLGPTQPPIQRLLGGSFIWSKAAET